MSESKPWEPTWKRVRSLGKGGQGHTFVVERQNDRTSAVLKVLLPQKEQDQKARRRMHQEVTNLQLLANAGGKVPRVLDSNTAHYEDIGVPLFFVMEHIPGQTLADCVEQKQGLPLATSIDIAVDLCRTLKIAVKEGISHRDIKPENIIIRDLESADVVIVDFGLSFNASEAPELTETNEALDNQFISLPERRGPAENKRDPRSDITGVCAILHFCLTRCRPRNLRDSRNRPPHRWENYTFANVPEPEQRRLLDALLDRAYQFEIALRFQTVDELESRLIEVKSPPDSPPLEDLEAIVRSETQALLKNDRKSQISEYTRQSQRVSGLLVNHFNQLHAKVNAAGRFRIEANRNVATEGSEIRGTKIPVEFAVWVHLEAHPLKYIVEYKIWAEGPECVVYRHIALTEDGRHFQTVDAWKPVYRYLGAEGPSGAILTQDMERCIGRAIRAMSANVQSSA